jgi:uncharacterized protein (DUF1501 family)
VLLALYLRGGADGIGLVVPTGDSNYYALRPTHRVEPGAGIDLDGFFAFHPALAALATLYHEGELAVVHAVGGTPGLRSHFEAQDLMENAAPRAQHVDDGWLNRALAALAAGDPWAGITLGPAPALALSGRAANLSIASLTAFAREERSERQTALEAMYAHAPDSLSRAAREAFAALRAVKRVEAARAALYPKGSFGAALADAAALIRADVGVRVVAIDLPGWDHHQSGASQLDALAGPLARGLAALREDLGSHWSRTCVAVMTEFGRTAAENGSLGTDHGAGSALFVLGAGTRGGRVLTRGGWPGLGPNDLFEGRDLAVTTDFRDVFAELLHGHLGLPLASLAGVLPGHAVSPANFPGLFA